MKLKQQIEQLFHQKIVLDKLTHQGCTSTVYEVFGLEQPSILKICQDPRYMDWLTKEAQVLEQLKDKNISVPKLIKVFKQNDEVALLMTKLKGNTLTEALQLCQTDEEKLAYIKSFGKFLHVFHEQRNVFPNPPVNWLDQQLQLAKTYVTQGVCDGNEALWQEINNNRPSQITQTMIHGDCTTDNVMVWNERGRCMYAFIDVAFMTVGDPRYDLALAIRKFNEIERNAFYDGYKRYRLTENEFDYFKNGLYEFF